MKVVQFLLHDKRSSYISKVRWFQCPLSIIPIRRQHSLLLDTKVRAANIFILEEWCALHPVMPEEDRLAVLVVRPMCDHR